MPEVKTAPPRRATGTALPSEGVVNLDEEAETVIARRLAGAEARSKALSEADHLAFEERIRQQPADHTATRRYTSRQLRDAVVWREILGPPVSFREGSDV